MRRISRQSVTAGVLEGRYFGFIIAHDMLDKRKRGLVASAGPRAIDPRWTCVVLREQPWNVMRRFRQSLGIWLGIETRACCSAGPICTSVFGAGIYSDICCLQ